MREKGQVSIEFILIVTIALVYVYLYVWPSIEISSQTAADIKAVADTKVSAMKLANALNEAATSSGDMKKTLSIFLPQPGILPQVGKISCNAAKNRIDYEVLLAKVKWNPMQKINPADPDEIGCIDYTDPYGKEFFKCSSSVGVLSGAIGASSCPDNLYSTGLIQLVVEKKGPDVSVYLKS